MALSAAELTSLTERAYVAFNDRDWDAFFGQVVPDYEWDPVEENVSYTGREAVVGYFERWLDAWREFEVEPQEIELAPSGHRTFVRLRYRARVNDSDAPIEGTFFHVLEHRDGVGVRGKEYLDETEARSAARLG